jgi:hypothetical protein
MPKARSKIGSFCVLLVTLLFASLVDAFPEAAAQGLPHITVALPRFTTEGKGLLIGAGQVYVRNAPASDLILSLTSSNPSLVYAHPQPFVAINAGENFGVFNLYIAEDIAYGGTQSVSITASTEGYTSGSDTIVVLDNDQPTNNTRGDVDHNQSIDLRDVILSLQITSGLTPEWLYPDADVNGDEHIGLAEALYALQVLAGLRIWDGSPPYVTGSNPGNEAVDILVDSSVEVTFNEEMDTSTLNSGTFILSDGAHAIDGTISYERRIATFRPSSPLNFDAGYQISLQSGIKDQAGNQMMSGYLSYFRTVALPNMISSVPAAGYERASINDPIEILFNNALDPASVTPETLKVTLSGATVTGSIELRGKTVIFTPASPLDYHTGYVVTLTTGVKDVYGHSLVSEKSFSFVTTSVKRTYVLAFPASDAVVDAAGKMAYFTSKPDKKLYRVNLETGVVEKETSLDYMPESIAVNPDKTRMYVALLTRDHDYMWWDEEQEGYIAEFDLATGAKLKQFRIDTDPYDLVATSDGHIYVTSGSGQWTNVDGYNVNTTLRTGRSWIRHLSRIKLHPSEQFAYTADTDQSPSAVTKYQISTGQVTRLWNSYPALHRMNGDLFIDPTGTRMVTKGGDLFALSSENSGDIQYIKSLAADSIVAAIFDPDHAAFLTVESQAIHAYDLDSFNRTGKIGITTYDKNFIYLNPQSDEIYHMGADANATYISILRSPVIVNE